MIVHIVGVERKGLNPGFFEILLLSDLGLFFCNNLEAIKNKIQKERELGLLRITPTIYTYIF